MDSPFGGIITYCAGEGQAGAGSWFLINESKRINEAGVRFEASNGGCGNLHWHLSGDGGW